MVGKKQDLSGTKKVIKAAGKNSNPLRGVSGGGIGKSSGKGSKKSRENGSAGHSASDSNIGLDGEEPEPDVIDDVGVLHIPEVGQDPEPDDEDHCDDIRDDILEEEAIMTKVSKIANDVENELLKADRKLYYRARASPIQSKFLASVRDLLKTDKKALYFDPPPFFRERSFESICLKRVYIINPAEQYEGITLHCPKLDCRSALRIRGWATTCRTVFDMCDIANLSSYFQKNRDNKTTKKLPSRKPPPRRDRCSLSANQSIFLPEGLYVERFVSEFSAYLEYCGYKQDLNKNATQFFMTPAQKLANTSLGSIPSCVADILKESDSLLYFTHWPSVSMIRCILPALTKIDDVLETAARVMANIPGKEDSTESANFSKRGNKPIELARKNVPVATGTLLVLTETGETPFYGLTSSARNEEFEEVLQFLKDGRHAHGNFKDPDAFFTDNCQTFSGSIKKIFPSTRSMQDLAHIIYRVVETLLRTNPSFKHMVQLVKDCFYSKKEIKLSNGKKVQVTRVRPNDRIAESLKTFEIRYKDKGVYNPKTFPSAVKNWPDGVESYYFIDNNTKVKEKQGSSNCENTHRSMHSTFYRGPVGPETQQERFSSFFMNLNCKRGARNRRDPFLLFAGGGLTLRLPEVDRIAELLNQFFGKDKYPRWPKPPPNVPKFDFFMLLRTATKKAKDVCSSTSDVTGPFSFERNDLARCLLPKILKEEEEEPDTSAGQVSNNFDDSSPSPLEKRKRQKVDTASDFPLTSPQSRLSSPPPHPFTLTENFALPTATKVTLPPAPFSTISTKSKEGRAFLTDEGIAIPNHLVSNHNFRMECNIMRTLFDIHDLDEKKPGVLAMPKTKFNAVWSQWNKINKGRQAVTETHMRVLLKMFVDSGKKEREMQLGARASHNPLDIPSSDSIDPDVPTDPAVAMSMALSRHGVIINTDQSLSDRQEKSAFFYHEEDEDLHEHLQRNAQRSVVHNPLPQPSHMIWEEKVNNQYGLPVQQPNDITINRSASESFDFPNRLVAEEQEAFRLFELQRSVAMPTPDPSPYLSNRTLHKSLPVILPAAASISSINPSGPRPSSSLPSFATPSLPLQSSSQQPAYRVASYSSYNSSVTLPSTVENPPLSSMVPGSVTKDRGLKTPQKCKRCGKLQKDDQQTVSTLEGRLCALASVGFNVRGFLLQRVMLSKEFDNRLFKEENMANAAGLRITIKPVVINLVKMNVSVDDALNKLFTFCGGEGDCTSDGLTFVAYVRKSVDDKADNRSLEDQIVMIKRWATYRGKGLQEALDLVHSNDTIAGLAVYRLDRFSRNTCHALGAIQDLVDKGKNFVSISEDGLLFGPLAVESQEISAMTQLLVKCLFAEIERLSAMKRTKDHVQTRREQEVGQSRFSPFGSIFTGTFDRKDFYSFDVADMKNRDKQANGVPEPLRLVQHTGENASVFVRSLKRFVKYQIKSGCEASMAADISFRMTILDATLTNPTWSDLVLDPVHNVEDWVMV
ncbi:hypothetical protein BC829DRAFT_416329 [Chytridium lagenaria]|nr:hypothetical protein BC829DRAFT_416329 [Chytridium lagenaria]